MRSARERRQRGNSRRSPQNRNLLELERLENRLALSHMPLAGPDAAVGLWAADAISAPGPSAPGSESGHVDASSVASLDDVTGFTAYNSIANNSHTMINEASPPSFASGFLVNDSHGESAFLVNPLAPSGVRSTQFIVSPVVVVIFETNPFPFEYSTTLISTSPTPHHELYGSTDAAPADLGIGRGNRPSGPPTVPVAQHLTLTSPTTPGAGGCCRGRVRRRCRARDFHGGDGYDRRATKTANPRQHAAGLVP